MSSPQQGVLDADTFNLIARNGPLPVIWPHLSTVPAEDGLYLDTWK